MLDPQDARRLHATLALLGRPTVLVLGDLMLDRYTWGTVTRISPEAPVPVLNVSSREARPGGAASVAALLGGLEVNVDVAGMVGDDGDGRLLRKMLADIGASRESILTDALRPTTVKERVSARTTDGQTRQLVRVDRESCQRIQDGLQRRLLDVVRRRIPKCQAVLVSDYGKGCCTRRVLRRVIKSAGAHGVPVLVDPARGGDWSIHHGCTLLKCNRSEAECACQTYLDGPASLQAASDRIRSLTGARHVVITLEGDGMFCDGELYPTQRRHAVDITGAGDMALAALGLCLAERVAIEQAVPLANVAAGLEVERIGCTTVARNELAAAIRQLCHSAGRKIVTLDGLRRFVAARRAEGKRVVFTNGCFGALHAGHIEYLREAKTLGDVLIVAINSSDSIRRLKGQRPIIADNDRLAMLAALDAVDYVLAFDDDTPHRLLEAIKPDVLVKGGTTRFVVGHEVVEAYGGAVRVLSAVPGVSTTEILAGRPGGQERIRAMNSTFTHSR